jgi:integrase
MAVGTPYSQTNRRKQKYIPLLQNAQLPYIRPHDLRHTAATLLLLEGVQPHVASEILGDAIVAITLDIYRHVSPDMQHDAAATVERVHYK